MTNQQLWDRRMQSLEWQMPISTLLVGAKGGVTMDQQANMEELIHHFVSHCPEGALCVFSMRNSESTGEEGQ